MIKKNAFLLLQALVFAFITSCKDYIEEAEAISNQNWSCKHSVKNSKVPTSRKVEFAVNFEEIAKKRKLLLDSQSSKKDDPEHTINNELSEIQIDTKSLEEIRKLALQDGANQYGDCATDLVNRTQDQLQRLCEKYAKEYKEGQFTSDYSMKRWCKKMTISYMAPLYEVTAGFYNPEKLDAKKIYEKSDHYQDSMKADMKQELAKSCSIPEGQEELYTDKRFMDKLKSNVSGLSSNCKKQISKSYTHIFINSAPPVPAKEPTTGKLIRDYTPAELQRRTNILSASKILLRDIPLKNTESKATHNQEVVKCESDTTKSEKNFLANLMRDIEAEQTCNKPGKGEEVKVNQSPSGVESFYTLKRVDDKKYEAVVNLKLESPEHLVDAQKCLKEKNKHLKGPGGKSFEVTIYDKDSPQTKSPPPEFEIALLEEGARSNSKAWEKGIKCGTIIHEIMHILGLADEYHEQLIGYHSHNGVVNYHKNKEKIPEEAKGSVKSYFNCRVQDFSGQGSLMSNHFSTFNSYAQTNDLYSGNYCFCPSAVGGVIAEGDRVKKTDESSCKTALKTGIEDGACPSGTLSRSFSFNSEEDLDSATKDIKIPEFAKRVKDSLKELKDQKKISEKGPVFTDNFILNAEFGKASNPDQRILTDGQFNLIIGPFCTQKNSTYNMCSNLSKKTFYLETAVEDGQTPCSIKKQKICKAYSETSTHMPE